MSVLPDVNVLLALAWPNHQFHHRARDWFRSRVRDGWCTCAVTQLGFIRLSSNPAYSSHARTPNEARMLLHELTRLSPAHRFLAALEPASHRAFQAVARSIPGHKQVTDSYLLALARRHGVRLATLDRRIAAWSPFEGVVELVDPEEG